MKIQFVKSLGDISYDDLWPLAKPEHRGKVARVIGSYGNKTLMIILPCGHHSSIEGWNITDIDTDRPSATPSIFCHGTENKPCWHGFLTNGELIKC